jgi:hypothetical protein
MMKILLSAMVFIMTTMTAYAFELPSNPAAAGEAIYLHQDFLDNGFGDQVSEVRMTLINRAGQESDREFRMQTLEVPGDGDKSLIVFKVPRDIRGTSLLTYEHIKADDNQWLYLPSLKRVKRIASQNKSGSFVGSELSYEDFASNRVEKYTYKYIKQDDLQGEKCWVVERYPLDENSGYSRQITWVSPANFQVMRIDYYDRKETLLKHAVFSEYKEYEENLWRAHKIEVDNVQTGKKTVLTIEKYSIRTHLEEESFSVRALERQR